ncbi:NYN domain-containing protein [Patescibacteria group bacterium]|nr:NYN domain-containing protein [Patescibacteria group bacterium]
MNKLKTKIYIDGANVFYTQKKLGWSIDWKKMKGYIEPSREVVEWRYYVGVKEGDEKMQKYLRYLDAIGFNLFTKALKKIRIYDNEILFKTYKTNFIYKSNVDVEITTDILLDKARIGEIIIFTGDSDFRYLVKKLKDVGEKVVIFSSKKTISWELKLEASDVIYLEDIKEHVARRE